MSHQRKEVYSPHDIARICLVSQQTVLDWFKEEKITYFKVPGGHSRVLHQDLEKFMLSRGIPKPRDWETEGPARFRVLVVEDDPDLLEIIGELLKDEPRVEVRKEDNGFAAGLQIAGWHPDLILLDFLMPGINGFDVCRKIREHPETSDIPVIALTSLSTQENRRAVLDSGVSEFLGKPFHSETLLKKVRVLLGLEYEVSAKTMAPRSHK